MSALCPAPEELSRALSQGATTGLVEHLASCSRCSDEWNGARRLRALVRSLPAAEPARRRVADVRARLVAEAGVARGRARKKSVAVAALAAFAAAAAVALAVALPGSAPRRPAPDASSARRHGIVTATQGARYALLGAAPDEVVLLESGSIHVEVTPLGAGERFRVRAGDGEVEVRGTAFDVSVEDGHMSAVTVQHGRVEVRGAGAATAMLGAGEGWHAASVAPPGEPAPDASGARPGSVLLRRHVVASQRTPPAPPPARSEGNASAPVESAAVVSRETPPAPPPAAPVSTAVNPPSTAAPAAPESAAPPAHDGRDRDDERRDRREERRERYDQRRMR